MSQRKSQEYYTRVLSSLMYERTWQRMRDDIMDRVMAETDAPELIDEFKERLEKKLAHHFATNKKPASADKSEDGFTPGITTGEGDVVVSENPKSSQDSNETSATDTGLQPGDIPAAKPAQPQAPPPTPPEERVETLPNGRAGQPYRASLAALVPPLPNHLHYTLTNDGGTGLTLGDELLLEGTPPQNGTFELQVCGADAQGFEALQLTLKLALIANSRDLWKDRAPDPDAPYAKPVEDAARIETSGGWYMVMGSQRGRSHAHRGDHRDDHGVIDQTDNGWHLLVIGDGAGSCPLSRQGSLLATTAARDTLRGLLAGEAGSALETAALEWWASGDITRMPQQLTRTLHDTVITAVHKGFKAITDEASAAQQPIKAFSTTLLLALHKPTPQGHVVVTFGIGDGAIAALPERGQARLMNVGDSGQHAGQTRFLDSQLFQEGQGLYQRVRVHVFDRLSAMVLATDGVTDPKFASDNDMHDGQSWWTLYDELAPTLDAPGEGQRDPLLDYLNFFVERHHDDRTVAVLYRNDAGNDVDTAEQSENTAIDDEAASAQSNVAVRQNSGETSTEREAAPVDAGAATTVMISEAEDAGEAQASAHDAATQTVKEPEDALVNPEQVVSKADTTAAPPVVGPPGPQPTSSGDEGVKHE